MNKISGIIILVVVIIIAGLAYFFTKNESTSDKDSGTNGSIVISIGDPSPSIEGVSEIRLSVDGVKLHSAENNWVTVSNDDVDYSLLALDQSGQVKLYTKEDVTVGNYDEIQMKVDSVTIVKTDGTEVKATLPSDEITIQANMIVKEHSTALVALNFLAGQSLHTTVDGQYVFAPVVKMEARSDAHVQVNEDNNTVISDGGLVTANTVVGVDTDGKTKVNFSISSGAKLELVNGEVTLTGEVNNKNATTTNADGSTKVNIRTSASSTLPSIEGNVSGDITGSL